MSAVEDYEAVTTDKRRMAESSQWELEILADAAISELEAKLDTLGHDYNALRNLLEVEQKLRVKAEQRETKEHLRAEKAEAENKRLRAELAMATDAKSAYEEGFNTGLQKGWIEAEDKYEPQLYKLQVCGTCDNWFDNGGRCYMDKAGMRHTELHDGCHVDPSRWTPYWEGE